MKFSFAAVVVHNNRELQILFLFLIRRSQYNCNPTKGILRSVTSSDSCGLLSPGFFFVSFLIFQEVQQSSINQLFDRRP